MTNPDKKPRRGGPVHSLLPRGLRWSGPLLSGVYGLGVRIHRSLSRAKFAPIATLCIGNITVGGTGKTPASIHVARELARRGRRPAILMRGYKAQGGDEAEEVNAALKDLGVPVLLGGDRHASACDAARRGHDVVLLDDGFQHWRLKRDLDIVLIDATNPFGGEKIIPQGVLREPLSGLARAGAIVVTRSDRLTELERSEFERQFARYAPETLIFYACHAPVGVRRLGSNEPGWTLARLCGLRAVVACGIGNPSAFSMTAQKAGAELCARETFSDHHDYQVNDVQRLTHLAREKKADAVLVTEKDAVKLEKLSLPEGVLFLALRVEFQIDNAAELWNTIDAALRSGDARRSLSRQPQ